MKLKILRNQSGGTGVAVYLDTDETDNPCFIPTTRKLVLAGLKHSLKDKIEVLARRLGLPHDLERLSVVQIATLTLELEPKLELGYEFPTPKQESSNEHPTHDLARKGGRS